jgi:hypothetical protein
MPYVSYSVRLREYAGSYTLSGLPHNIYVPFEAELSHILK